MRKVTENQLSWFALLMTAFYSLLTSCRADNCGQEELDRCARPLQKMTNSSMDYFKSKASFQELCPELEAVMQCIRTYTMRCINDRQRKHFTELYSGTHIAVMELCHDGLYQDEFLKHAPCMNEVKSEFDRCSSKFGDTMHAITTSQKPNDIKSICCSFREYLTCSHNTVLKTCGTATADFAKKFLDRMSASLIKMHCQSYSYNECVPAENGSPGGIKVGSFILPLVLITASRYLY